MLQRKLILTVTVDPPQTNSSVENKDDLSPDDSTEA
jgi:hypothetical protein